MSHDLSIENHAVELSEGSKVRVGLFSAPQICRYLQVTASFMCSPVSGIQLWVGHKPHARTQARGSQTSLP